MASIKEKIVACVDRFIAEGGAIIEGEWNVGLDEDNRYVADLKRIGPVVDGVTSGPARPCACPLGAVLAAQDPREWTDDLDRDVAGVLGVEEDWVRSFIAGFDDANVNEAEFEEGGSYDKEAFLFGQFMRDRHIVEQHPDE